jgi:hypothetical protein
MSSFTQYYNRHKEEIEIIKKELETLDICKPKTYLNDLKIFSDQEKDSKSTSVILKGTITNINKEIIIKCSPIDFKSNSLIVESQIYKIIISELLNNNNTPCLVSFVDHKICGDKKCAKIDKEIKNETKSNLDLDFSKLNFLILENINSEKFIDFLERINTDNFKDLIAILFQIFYTCYCFAKIGLKHNDLHFNNIFIVDMKEEYTFYFDLGNLGYYSSKTKYLVKIYDFDNSSSLDDRIFRNSFCYGLSLFVNDYDPFSNIIEFIRNLNELLKSPEMKFDDLNHTHLEYLKMGIDKLNSIIKNYYNAKSNIQFVNQEPYLIFTSKVNNEMQFRLEPLFEEFIKFFIPFKAYKEIKRNKIPETEIIFSYPKEKNLKIVEYKPKIPDTIKEYSTDYQEINKMARKYNLEEENIEKEEVDFVKSFRDVLIRDDQKNNVLLLKKLFKQKYKDYNKLDKLGKSYIDWGLNIITSTYFYDISNIFVDNSKDKNIDYLLFLFKKVFGDRLPITLKKMILI